MRLPVKLPAICLVFLMLVLVNTPVLAATKKKVNPQPESVIKTAEKYLKTPYRFGGESPRGFDCSGFVKFVYDKHGKKLPRTADVQYKTGKKVARSKLKPGDLVFFNTYGKGVSHVGIYYGGGNFIHASSSRGVIITKLEESYWKPRYLGARRIMN